MISFLNVGRKKFDKRNRSEDILDGKSFQSVKVT